MTKQSGDENSAQKETDFLVYRGNAFPRILRLVWTIFMIFLFYYLFASSNFVNELSFVKDLNEWISKMNR